MAGSNSLPSRLLLVRLRKHRLICGIAAHRVYQYRRHRMIHRGLTIFVLHRGIYRVRFVVSL